MLERFGHRERIPAEEARQGRIVLMTPLQRATFVAGLAGAVIVALIVVWSVV